MNLYDGISYGVRGDNPHLICPVSSGVEQDSYKVKVVGAKPTLGTKQSQCRLAWPSHLLWEQDIASSNLATETNVNLNLLLRRSQWQSTDLNPNYYCRHRL